MQVVVSETGSEVNVSLVKPQPSLPVPDAGKPLFFIARIALSNPKFDLWDVQISVVVNPKLKSPNFLGAGSPIAAELKGVKVPEELGLMIRKKRSKATTEIDEIRFGRHWEEMAFQPPQKDPAPTPPPAKPGAPVPAAVKAKGVPGKP
jgi:hypothetical protein